MKAMMMTKMIFFYLVFCILLVVNRAFFARHLSSSPATTILINRQSSLHMSAFKQHQSTIQKAMKTLPSLISLVGFGIFNQQPAFADYTPSPWNERIEYEVIKEGKGDAPKPGELVEVRFKATYKGAVIDDTFSTLDPYIYRCGVGVVIPGLDESILHMKAGERVKLHFGGDLAFPNGKPSAPGRARIPPNAVVDYEVELVSVPGRGEDVILDDI